MVICQNLYSQTQYDFIMIYLNLPIYQTISIYQTQKIYESWLSWLTSKFDDHIQHLPVVPHKAVAEVSKIGNL
jgi:hypothetical protein